MSDVLHNLKLIQYRINQACIKANRLPGSVKLLLATKTVSVERIKQAFDNGYTLIGENKIQEVKEKFEGLKGLAHEAHFIGHLQTNKIRDVLKYGITCIQSLDRMDLAEKLHRRLVSENKTMDVLVQVNTSGEPSKFGVSPKDTVSLVEQVAQFTTLKIKGLMTIAVFDANAERVRPCFRLLKSLQMEIQRQQIPGVQMGELSMGMSHDFEAAIEEGATLVRIGTAVFGPRLYPDSYYWNENTTPHYETL